MHIALEKLDIVLWNHWHLSEKSAIINAWKMWLLSHDTTQMCFILENIETNQYLKCLISRDFAFPIYRSCTNTVFLQNCNYKFNFEYKCQVIDKFLSIFQLPGWTLVTAALGLFIYQALDAIDGKQARRTGSATPLGELFDHGCDSLSTGEAQLPLEWTRCITHQLLSLLHVFCIKACFTIPV